MSLIIDTVTAFLPPKRKHTPSGWTSFDAVCCHHNGQSPDRRKRGGIMITEGVTYHCFNCGFKASWQPGRTLTKNFKKLLKWINVPDDQINQCVFEALREREAEHGARPELMLPKFIEKHLPLGARPLTEWINDDPEKIIPVIEYLLDRGFGIDDYNWYWTDEEGFNNRLIVPFYYQNKLVGWTARLMRDGKLKYISEQQPGYVFNLDHQTWDRKLVIVTEGPLDAIGIDGCAVMTNEIGPQQLLLLKQLNKEILVCPDKDKAGVAMAEQALNLELAVSLPDWPHNPSWDHPIKDINDAVRKLGKITTLWLILEGRQTSTLKAQLKLKNWLDEKN
jgi:hypothetical protein